MTIQKFAELISDYKYLRGLDVLTDEELKRFKKASNEIEKRNKKIEKESNPVVKEAMENAFNYVWANA